MNKQEFFNAVYLGLMNQGKKSSHGDACAYRGEDGTKCGIGLLISNELANHIISSPETATSRILYLLEGAPGVFPSYMYEDVGFTQDLQNMHDFTEKETFLSDLRKNAARYAARYDLTIPEFVQ